MTTTHRTATSALLVLSLAAAGVPAASARPAGPELTGPAHHTRALYSRQDKSLLPPNDPPSSAATTSGPRSEVVSGGGYGTATPAIVRVTSPSTGFDWGDAGIGAGGGIALSMIGLGGALGVSQNRARRRTRRTHTTALPS